jgi:Zn-dependent peptidase ImmA (M78 family)
MVLSKDRIDYIEALAQTTLDDALQQKIILPIPIQRIVAYYGLTLKIGKFDNSEVVGSYQRDTKVISVSQDDPYTRTSFTIAHELGHHFLHAEMPSEIFYRAATYQPDVQDDKIEAEANCFAACLLMPLSKMKVFYPFLKNEPDKLADLFGVSKIAMNYRIKNLKLQ